MSLSKKDLEILSKAASSLPRNTPGRELLASLTKKEASGEIKPFTRNDYMGYAGAESWYEDTPEEVQPFIADMGVITIPWAHVSKVAKSEAEDIIPTDKWYAVLIGDSAGIQLSLDASPLRHSQYTIFLHHIDEAEPDEVLALMKGAVRSLKSGKIPSWLKSQ